MNSSILSPTKKSYQNAPNFFMKVIGLAPVPRARVMSLEGMEQRWAAFGWDVSSVDGHNQETLAQTIAGLTGDRPHVLVAHTTFGKGVSFMEGQIPWHYLPMNDEQFRLAMSEIGA